METTSTGEKERQSEKFALMSQMWKVKCIHITLEAYTHVDIIKIHGWFYNKIMAYNHLNWETIKRNWFVCTK